MSADEVRLERLLAAEVRERMARAPICWLPWGALEFHAEHLPFGTDGFAAQRVVELAARRAGGVVLPWTALTLGTLHLPWTFRYEADLVERALRATIRQAAAHGARVVVVHTGHGPLDLNHLIKRVCAEVEGSVELGPEFRAYGLCYLELNAALGTGLGTGWPVAVDHGSIMETSWMLGIEPDLVDLERLPEDPAATGIVGIYGPNPRDLASAAVGTDQVEACAALLAERATALLAGGRIDPLEDLRGFVARYWPEPLELSGRAGGAGVVRGAGGGSAETGATDAGAAEAGAAEAGAALLMRNPGPVSRYLTGLSLALDGRAVDSAAVVLLNATVGEAGVPVPAASLGPEAGFYVRRQQSAEIRLPLAVAAGPHRVKLTVGLAGVAEASFDQEVVFA